MKIAELKSLRDDLLKTRPKEDEYKGYVDGILDMYNAWKKDIEINNELTSPR